MSTKGIIFSAPMVRALLAGTKTQTRRLFKPHGFRFYTHPISGDRYEQHNRDGFVGSGPMQAFGWGEGLYGYMPYAPGDRLYVREALYLDDLCIPPFIYSADEQRIQWRNREQVAWLNNYPRQKVPSIHMPRWASRLWLDVTEVRVQRLQDISEEDCIAEGIERSAEYPNLWRRGPLKGDQNNVSVTAFPTLAYRSIWEALHTKPGQRWEDNPWIVAVSFNVHHGNIDQAAK
jgi:hypothetical protein